MKIFPPSLVFLPLSKRQIRVKASKPALHPWRKARLRPEIQFPSLLDLKYKKIKIVSFLIANVLGYLGSVLKCARRKMILVTEVDIGLKRVKKPQMQLPSR